VHKQANTWRQVEVGWRLMMTMMLMSTSEGTGS
jgi:hypothetical protein